MKAISLLQPYASLVAIGAKKIETRSWATKYRGPLAIHASKKAWRYYSLFEHDRLIALTLLNAGYHASKDLPYGAIIATCNLVDCLYVKGDGLFKVVDKGPGYVTTAFAPEMLVPDEPELSFGDFTTGRYAWILEDVHQLPEPIPAKGKLRLWEWEPKGVVLS